MKQLAIAAAAALALAGQAHAEDSMSYASPSRLYLELGYTFLTVHAAGTDARPDAWRGILGYDAMSNLALELMAGGNANDESKSVNVNGTATNVNFKMSSMYGILARPHFDVGQAQFFGRFGWARTHVKAASQDGLVNETQSDNDFAWGLGASYRFGGGGYVALDWMRYDNQSGHRVDGYTVTAGYHF